MKEEKSGLEEAEKNSTNAGLRNYTRQRGHLFYSRDPDVSSEWKGDKENAVPKKTRVLLTMFQKIFLHLSHFCIGTYSGTPSFLFRREHCF